MSYTLQIGQKAPDFSLKSTQGEVLSLASFEDSSILVIFFTCNHCPYVLGSDENTRALAEKFAPKARFVAINSNSKNTYAEDSYENMIKRMEEKKFPWVYLHDASQEIARRYGALKTPHFFVFSRERKLIYTGRAIDHPRDASKAKIFDLEKALQQHLEGKDIETPITNPIGCNVKWDGKDAHWMPKEACDLV